MRLEMLPQTPSGAVFFLTSGLPLQINPTKSLRFSMATGGLRPDLQMDRVLFLLLFFLLLIFF